tara:strand:+ start:341 stop:784 length:444 start_codon:yes stop_codon:yes gene_type:complete
MYQNLNKLFLTSFVLLSLFLIPCNAQVNNFRSSELTPDQFGIGKVAANVQSHYKSIGRLVLGTSYLAGIAFVVACLFKFKQHKDNPTQVTIGTPFTLLLIGIFMIFLPGLIKPVGETVFGHGVHATNSYSGRVLTSNLFDEDDDLLW